MDNVFVRYLEHAPASFHGSVADNGDGTYSVYLDPNDSVERRLEAYRHELEKHILRDDFARRGAVSIQQIEAEAHEG